MREIAGARNDPDGVLALVSYKDIDEQFQKSVGNNHTRTPVILESFDFAYDLQEHMVRMQIVEKLRCDILVVRSFVARR